MKVWNDDDRRFLKSRYGRTSNRNLARHFKCSAFEVAEEARRLALSKDKAKFKVRKMPRWTEKDVARLRELYPTTPNIEIALALGRSRKSVDSKAHLLGLEKSPARLRAMGRANVDKRYNRNREAS